MAAVPFPMAPKAAEPTHRLVLRTKRGEAVIDTGSSYLMSRKAAEMAAKHRQFGGRTVARIARLTWILRAPKQFTQLCGVDGLGDAREGELVVVPI